jgi:hypothetical protein
MSDLHFGCFNYPRDGWVNTDGTPHLYIARVPDVTCTTHKLGEDSDERMNEHKKAYIEKFGI